MKLPKKAYDDQKRHASARGIPWNLSYEDFLELWLVSGKWSQRGKKINDFCMCRFGDKGPYSKTNVFIGSVKDNLRERWVDRELIDKGKAVEIRHLYSTRNHTQQEIADKFGVTQSYVSKIIGQRRKILNEYTAD